MCYINIKKVAENLKYLNKTVLCFFFVLRIITDDVVLFTINDFWLGWTGITILPVNIKALFTNNHFQGFNAVYGLFAAFYVAPFLTAYTYARNENPLYQLYLKSKFKLFKLLEFLFIVIVTQGTTSKIFITASFCYIFFFQLLPFYVGFYKFVFNKSESLLNFLEQSLGIKSTDWLKFKKVKEELDTWAKETISKEELQDNKLLITKTVACPVAVSRSKLNAWFDAINEMCLSGGLRFSSPSKLSKSRSPEGAKVSFAFEDQSLSVFAYVVYPSKILLDDYEEDISCLFKSCFRQGSLSAADNGEIFDEYNDKVSLRLLSCIERNEFDHLYDELNLIAELMSRLGESPLSEFQLLRLNIAVEDAIESSTMLSKYKACHNFLIDYWHRFFKSIFVIKSKKYTVQAFSLLDKCVDRGVFSDSISRHTIERNITTVLKYNDNCRKFLFVYVDSIVDVARDFRDGDNQKCDFFSDLIMDLDEDIEMGYIKPLDEDFKEVQVYCKEAILFLTCLMNQAKKNALFEVLVKKIDERTFFKVFCKLYTSSDKAWKISAWSTLDFDRHGSGGVKSYSELDFYARALICILRSRGELMQGPMPEIGLKNLFRRAQDLVASIKEEDQSSVVASYIEGVVNEFEKTEKEKLIKEDISNTKVLEFVKHCEDAYYKQSKISEYMGTTIRETEDANGIGYTTTMPKEYFCEGRGMVLIGLGDFGKGLAGGENQIIYDKFKASQKHECMSRKRFYNDVLPDWIRCGDEFDVITSNLTYRSADFIYPERTCKFNKNIKLFIDVHGDTFITSASERGSKIRLKRMDMGGANKESFYIKIAKHTDLNLIHNVNNSGGFKAQGPITYQVLDLAKEDELREKIVDSDDYFEGSNVHDRDLYLKGKVSVRLYIGPVLNIPVETSSFFLVSFDN